MGIINQEQDRYRHRYHPQLLEEWKLNVCCDRVIAFKKIRGLMVLLGLEWKRKIIVFKQRPHANLSRNQERCVSRKGQGTG